MSRFPKKLTCLLEYAFWKVWRLHTFYKSLCILWLKAMSLDQNLCLDQESYIIYWSKGIAGGTKLANSQNFKFLNSYCTVCIYCNFH